MGRGGEGGGGGGRLNNNRGIVTGRPAPSVTPHRNGWENNRTNNRTVHGL